MYENCVTNQQMLNMHFSTKHKKQCDIVLHKKPTKNTPQSVAELGTMFVSSGSS